jgi:hypothetical protein
MITFRKLIGNINKTKGTDQQSPLEKWFERVIDIPLEELSVEDLCRAIRQEICIDQLMPRALEILTEDPLAGEYYDGELISALATVKMMNLKDHIASFQKAKALINKIDTSTL